MQSLTFGQIITLETVGIFNANIYQTYAKHGEAPSYECLLATSTMIFVDELDCDDTVEAFEAQFPNEDYEVVCMILECA